MRSELERLARVAVGHGRDDPALDVFLVFVGALVAAVPRWRLETEGGSSTKGRTFEDAQLVAQAERLVATLGLEGPLSIRGFMLSSNGLYCFTGVTPGFSGGLSLSLAAGADLVGEYVRGMFGLPLRRSR